MLTIRDVRAFLMFIVMYDSMIWIIFYEPMPKDVIQNYKTLFCFINIEIL